MNADDLPLIRTLSRPSLSPDGSLAVVAVSRPDFTADRYLGQLWLVATDGSVAPRRLTRGLGDSAPRFSPDGREIAFLRAADGAPQIHVVDARGGEPVRVTEAPLGVSEFVWRPDGGALAYVARIPEPGRYGSVDGIGPDAEQARLITELSATANGVGYVFDRRLQLFVVAAPDTQAEPVAEPFPDATLAQGAEKPVAAVVPAPSIRLSDGPFDHSAPVFSPDGRSIAVISARHDGRDTDRRSAVYVFDAPSVLDGPALDVDGSIQADPRVATASAPDLSVDAVVWPGEHRLLVLGADYGPTGRDFVGRNTSLHVVDLETGDVRRVTDPAEFAAADGAVPVETADGVLLARSARGRSELVVVSDDGRSTTLLGGDIEVHGVAAAGQTIVATISAPDTYGELVDVSSGRRLTDFGGPLRAHPLATPTEFETAAPDGYPVHGWVAVPEGDGPHPVLLLIHGGPFSQYTVSLFDETQVYVDAGYAVVYCNPRGSSGYGEAHGRAIRQAMGTVDMDDVLAFLDGAIASDPRLDGERVGILGGSYGGYLTAWTIAHDHRFAAAIVERGFLDPDVFVGTSDIGMFFGDEYVGTDPERMRAQSPQAVVGDVTTPTFVMHSEKDLRCPLSQAERYFAALRRNGVETQLMVFPGENHELSRSGRPRHRRERFDAILDWWARYLPTETNHR